MITVWTERRLQRLFKRYNKRFWQGGLDNWTVDTDESHCEGLYGHCDGKGRTIHVRVSAHTSDRSVRATLVHEMAHAATNGDHGTQWRREIERLKAAGAPTESLAARGKNRSNKDPSAGVSLPAQVQ